MDDSGNVSERGKELGQKKKKRRGGTKFSNSKALKRSAMRKRGESSSIGDQREPDDYDLLFDDEVLPPFRRNINIQSFNLESVLESLPTDETEEMEEQGHRSQLKTSSNSVGVDGEDDGAEESKPEVMNDS